MPTAVVLIALKPTCCLKALVHQECSFNLHALYVYEKEYNGFLRTTVTKRNWHRLALDFMPRRIKMCTLLPNALAFIFSFSYVFPSLFPDPYSHSCRQICQNRVYWTELAQHVVRGANRFKDTREFLEQEKRTKKLQGISLRLVDQLNRAGLRMTS